MPASLRLRKMGKVPVLGLIRESSPGLSENTRLGSSSSAASSRKNANFAAGSRVAFPARDRRQNFWRESTSGKSCLRFSKSYSDATPARLVNCLLYTSDAADDLLRVAL